MEQLETSGISGKAIPMSNTPPPLPRPRRKKRHIWPWLIFILVVAVIVFAGRTLRQVSKSSALVHSKLMQRGMLSDRAVDEFPEMNEVWSYGNGTVKVARIAVHGVIMRTPQTGVFAMQGNMVDTIISQIRHAQGDEKIKAIILDVDSPGGGVTASDEIYKALQDFRASKEDRKVVVYMRDLAASGGYYVSMASDWLIAQPTTVLGSIGVIMQSYNVKGLGEKLGVTDVTIKSGANKDLLNPFSEVDPAQMALLQEMINSMYEHFLGIVAKNRAIPAQDLRALADGRIFVAERAKELALVDQIGYWDDVMKKTAELLGEDSIKVVRYEQPMDFMRWIMGIRAPLQPLNWLAQYNSRFLYLWQP